MLSLLDEAVASGARLRAACDLLNLSTRSVERWRVQGGGDDQRNGPLTPPAHKLSPAEREAVLAAANCAEFRDKSPRQIVPTLADRGQYKSYRVVVYKATGSSYARNSW